MIIISDTSPITSLSAIQKLELLHQLYQTVIIPEAVYLELTDTNFPVPGAVEVQTLEWIQVKKVTNSNFAKDLQEKHKLDPGESEAIALAMQLNADLLLIDEKLGREVANSLGVSITGLLGLLVEAKTRGLISEIRPVLDSLINLANFRVSEQLYQRILQITGE